MRLTSAISDYMHAIHAGARGSLLRAPAATYSVLRSRFSYGIGPRLHSLFSLGEVPPHTWPEYKVDAPLRKLLQELNPPCAREIANDKLLFHTHCVTHSLATVPVICCLTSDKSSSPYTVTSFEEWNTCIDQGPDRLFLKIVNGSWGWNAFVAEQRLGRWHFSGRSGTSEDFFEFCRDRLSSARGWIVQPLLNSHRLIREISSAKALSTVRMVTRGGGGKGSLLYAAIKLPHGENVTDNFLHGTTGNMIAAVEMSSGILGRCKGAQNGKWSAITESRYHPTTKAPIEGFQLPFWEDAKNLVLRGQASLPQLKTIGWDVAITDEGPVLVEANANWDADLLQVAFGRGLKSEIFSLLVD